MPVSHARGYYKAELNYMVFKTGFALTTGCGVGGTVTSTVSDGLGLIPKEKG